VDCIKLGEGENCGDVLNIGCDAMLVFCEKDNGFMGFELPSTELPR
jgi:hypothetical protein